MSGSNSSSSEGADSNTGKGRAGIPWFLTLMSITLVPGLIAAAVGKSPFAILWITVFTALGISVAAALIPQS
ncbi:hypothetical protein [Prescottella equi]